MGALTCETMGLLVSETMGLLARWFVVVLAVKNYSGGWNSLEDIYFTIL